MKKFKEFLKERVVRRQYPDEPRAENLIKESNRKFKNLKRTIEEIGIDDENSNDIVEDCHDTILGIIRAKMLLKGFGASGKGAHEAEVSFLNELNFTEQEIEFVNKLRYFRNGILYYGKRFDKEYAKKVFDFLNIFKEKLNPFYIIIRGPLGIGKTTIAESLAKEIVAEHIAYDEILEEYGLTEDKEKGYISQKSFFKANEIAAERVKKFLGIDKPVIFDGNFYWKSQIDDLISKLNYPHYVFTLKAPLKVCIERDARRKKKHEKDAVLSVFKKSTSFEYGIQIDTENKTGEEVVEEIKKRLE